MCASVIIVKYKEYPKGPRNVVKFNSIQDLHVKHFLYNLDFKYFMERNSQKLLLQQLPAIDFKVFIKLNDPLLYFKRKLETLGNLKVNIIFVLK